ncbi:MAG: DUF2007 domain-containing protein [Gemmatimonadota bacterium]|nr:MAG: DUF2007 domain-containing protein [Gemmatimonadota bacterium]
MTHDEEKLVAVANFRTRSEAETASGLLLGADIPYVIQSLEGAQLGPGPGGTTVLVRPQDEQQARQILQDAGALPDEGA